MKKAPTNKAATQGIHYQIMQLWDLTELCNCESLRTQKTEAVSYRHIRTSSGYSPGLAQS